MSLVKELLDDDRLFHDPQRAEWRLVDEVIRACAERFWTQVAIAFLIAGWLTSDDSERVVYVFAEGRIDNISGDWTTSNAWDHGWRP